MAEEEQSAPARTPRAFAEHLKSETIKLRYIVDPDFDPEVDDFKDYYINRSILAQSSVLLKEILEDSLQSKTNDVASLQIDNLVSKTKPHGEEMLVVTSYDSEDIEVKQAAFECFLQYAYLHYYSLVELEKPALGKRLLLHTHIYVIAHRLESFGLLQRAADAMLDILLEQMEEDVDPLSVLSALDLLFANTPAGLTRKTTTVKLKSGTSISKAAGKKKAQQQRPWTEYDTQDLLMRQAFAAHAYHKLRNNNETIVVEGDETEAKDGGEYTKPSAVPIRTLYEDALDENSDLAVIVALHDFSSLFQTNEGQQTAADSTTGTPSWLDLFEYISTFQFRHAELEEVSVEVEFMLQQLPPGRFTKDCRFIPVNSTTALTPAEYEQTYYRDYPKPAELKMIWNALKGYTRKQLAEVANEKEEDRFWEALKHFPEGRFVIGPTETVFVPINAESLHEMGLEEYEQYYEIPFPDETTLLALWLHNKGFTRKPKRLLEYVPPRKHDKPAKTEDAAKAADGTQVEEDSEDETPEDKWSLEEVIAGEKDKWSLEEVIAGEKEATPLRKTVVVTTSAKTTDNTDAKSTASDETLGAGSVTPRKVVSSPLFSSPDAKKRNVIMLESLKKEINNLVARLDSKPIPSAHKESVTTRFQGLYQRAQEAADNISVIDTVIWEIRGLKSELETLMALYYPTSKKENLTPNTTAESSPAASPFFQNAKVPEPPSRVFGAGSPLSQLTFSTRKAPDGPPVFASSSRTTSPVSFMDGRAMFNTETSNRSRRAKNNESSNPALKAKKLPSHLTDFTVFMANTDHTPEKAKSDPTEEEETAEGAENVGTENTNTVEEEVTEPVTQS
ncbi:hypothetical protein BJ508DRAFT_329346 [Ascobolus immersus RN42]|uniref:BTB domain-containing protein n=1 Tax=Ascobolus immersus RN42 TaxID=1160509 RepID=A0A3N4HXJ7_ASCIM|nr:hypothetical protein BJ508DRAFT_329346 [Ascobolus immersus RN42]